MTEEQRKVVKTYTTGNPNHSHKWQEATGLPLRICDGCGRCERWEDKEFEALLEKEWKKPYPKSIRREVK